MPKKSTKSKSKRKSVRDMLKVHRKVKEHNRKQRKQARKAGNKSKPSLLKDPGVPSNYPYREQFMKEMAFEKQRILAKEAAKKEEKKARRAARMNGESDDDMTIDTASEMLALRASAHRSQEDFEARASAGLAAAVSGDHDNSRKWFYKEFKKVVDLADVVIQVLDARDPMSCRCDDVERYIRSVNPNKKIILILNKIDLVPQEVAEQWLKYYRQELPTVAFKAATKKSGSQIAHARMPTRNTTSTAQKGVTAAQVTDDLLASSECLGADTLLQLLKNYTRNLGIKTAITVGVVGMPNVGKSSLINSLKRSKVAQVGNTPGVTKTVQEIHLDKQIRLLDSPGVVFATAESEAAAALRNCVKIEKLADPVTPVNEILNRVPARRLMQLYKIAAFEGAEQMLQRIAAARGKLKKGGTVDIAAAARVVLQDWNDGRIPFFTRPPSRGNEAHESAQLVGGYAADFDADAVFATEQSAVIQGLPSERDGNFVEVQAGQAAQVDFASLDKEAMQHDAMEDSDQEDMMDNDDMQPAAPADASGSSAAGQNLALYGEVGQYNPKLAKAAKKKARRARASGNESYDFAEWDDSPMQ